MSQILSVIESFPQSSLRTSLPVGHLDLLIYVAFMTLNLYLLAATFAQFARSQKFVFYFYF